MASLASCDLGVAEWSYLPEELLIRILVLVDNATLFKAVPLVNHSWLEAGRVASSRRIKDAGMLDLRWLPARQRVTLSDEGIQRLLERSDNTISRVCLDRCLHFSSSAADALILRGGSIRHLDFSGCTKTNEALLAGVVHACPSLEGISLGGCQIGETLITALSGHSRLSRIRIPRCNFTRIKQHYMWLNTLLSGCGERLFELDVARNIWITDSMMVQSLHHAPNLKSLSLRDCTSLSSETLFAIAVVCEELETLDIAELGDCDDDNFRQVVEVNSKLKKINLSSNPGLTYESIESICDFCENLQVLCCSNFDSFSLHAFSRVLSLQNIRTLGLAGVQMVDEDEIFRLVAVPHTLCSLDLDQSKDLISATHAAFIHSTSLPNLSHLSMRGVATLTEDLFNGIIKSCPNLMILNVADNWLGDKSTTSIAIHCPKLVDLNISRNNDMSANGISHLVARLKFLRALAMGGIDNVSDKCLKAIAKNRLQLQRLDLSKCNYITDSGLTHIASTFDQLRMLHLDFSEQLTDESLFDIADGCPELVDISLQSLHQITTDGLSALKQCKKLNRLNIRDCFGISNTSMPKFSDGIVCHEQSDADTKLLNCNWDNDWNESTLYVELDSDLN